MSLYITSLNSGSNGNCYYIGNKTEAILVDAGLSCRETEKRLRELGLTINIVRAIFISHEHSDHIRGLRVMAKKYQLPVYITPKTLVNSGLDVCGHLIKSFSTQAPVHIGELEITAFSKIHDAAEPHSFTVRYNSITIGIFTDIGTPCDELIRHFKQCNAAFLEANYDEKMLETGRYPYHLKQRIRGGKGHLSNAQALDLFKTHRSPYLSHLLLSHLSHENNCPDLLMKMFAPHAEETAVIVASRFKATTVFTIHDNVVIPIHPGSPASFYQGALF